MEKNIINWKIKEINGFYDVISIDSLEFIDKILKQLKLPLNNGNSGLYKQDTAINWSKMPQYYKLFFDEPGWEKRITNFFIESELKNTSHLIITYGKNEPVIKIPTKLFIDDWEGFIRSTLWESFIFSEDYKLIMEISRDYCLHSNFRIVPKKYEKELDCD